MKVFVLSYLYPNSEFPNHGVFVHNRIKAVAKHVDIIVVNPIPWSPIYRFFDRYRSYKNIPLEETIEGVKVYHPRFLSIPKMLKVFEVWSYKRSVTKLYEEKLSGEKFDIVDLHWTFPDLPTGAYLKNRLGVKMLTTIRGNEALHLGENNFSEKCVSEYLKYTDGVVGVSEDLKVLASPHAINSSLQTAIRNGVDTERFTFIDKGECRERLKIATSQKIVFSVGSLIHRKGFDLIINALHEMRKKQEFGSTVLYIGGSAGHEGDYRLELDKLIESFGLKDSVVFVGQISNSDLVFWYNAADVFCLASRGEGSPNVLTEALACGCPSVVTDVGAAKEVLESEPGQGVCVAVDDALSLQKGIQQLLSESHDRKLLSSNFRKYTWDWCGERVVSVYNQLLKV
ncbi:hypothetical protein A9Q81_11385 [Gammaproteobacteria bacterium 42_54_T18]|nr:hypothetical protein A9Q81_11385 [Gammaproteobacteria bacterium 42_54_T18]